MNGELDKLAKVVEKGFELIDANHDGKTTKGDLLAYYAKQHVVFSGDIWYNHCPDPETPRTLPEAREEMKGIEVLFLFVTLDKNNDGQLSFDEWKVFAQCLGAPNDEEIRKGFNKVDLNKDGQLSIEEFDHDAAKLFNGELHCCLF